VTFKFPAPPLGLLCEWDPDIPHFTSNRAARRFEKAYIAARDEFLQEVAQLLDASIVNIDLDEHARPSRITDFTPRPVN
jgi:hypothetical protein